VFDEWLNVMGDFPVVGAAEEEEEEGFTEELLTLGGLEETAVEGFMLFALVEGETAAGEGWLRLGGMVVYCECCTAGGVVGSQCKSL